MAAPQIYKSTDGNAPVMRGERRALIDVLRACLVDGYGDKTPAGWTLEFINATFDKAVFRNSPVTGTGFYLRVDGLSPANTYTQALKAYEIMTDIDNGSGMFGSPVTSQDIWTASTAGTTSRPWVLVADDRAFYLFIWHSITAVPTNANYDVTGLFFGDIIPRLDSDAFAAALCASNSNQYYIWGSHTTAGSGNLVPSVSVPPYFACHFPRRENAAAGGVTVPLIHGGGPYLHNSPGAVTNVIAYSANDPLVLSMPYFSNGAAYTLRGWFPGLYFPCHPLPFEQWATAVKDDRSFFSIRNSIYVAPITPTNILISLDDWRA